MWRSLWSHGLTGTVRMRLCNGWIDTSGSYHTSQDNTFLCLGEFSSRNAPLKVRMHPLMLSFSIIQNSLYKKHKVTTLHPVPCALDRMDETVDSMSPSL